MHGQGKPSQSSQPGQSRPDAISNRNRTKQIYNRNLFLKVVILIGSRLAFSRCAYLKMHGQGKPAHRRQPEQDRAGLDLGVELFIILRKWSTAFPQYTIILDMNRDRLIGAGMIKSLLGARKYSDYDLYCKTVYLLKKLKFSFRVIISKVLLFHYVNVWIWIISTFSTSS